MYRMSVDLTATPETPSAEGYNVVVLDDARWRLNEAFDRLIGQHLVQYHHLGIDKLAASIIRHWIGNHGGSFIDVSASGEQQSLLDESLIAVKVATLIQKAVTLPPLCLQSCQIPSINTPANVSQSPDDTISSSSPFNHSLCPIQDDEPKIGGIEVLLPMIPQDIFDQPMPELCQDSSRDPSTSPLPKLSLSMKTNTPNSDIIKRLQLGGIATITSISPTPTHTREDCDLLTPKFDNTTGNKNQATGTCQLETKSRKLPQADPTRLPSRKRLKKSVSFNVDTKPPSHQPQSNDKEFSPIRNKNHRHIVDFITANDVVFAGASARSHKGNLIFNEWMARFCKGINANSCIPEIATQIVSLFKKLQSRFLEVTTSAADGQIRWVELDELIVVKRTGVLIQKMFDDKKTCATRNSKPRLNFHSADAKISRTVPILKIDVESLQICQGNDSVVLESNEPIHLWTNDVLLGKQIGRETHYGNLKFFHHIDDHIPRYERTISVGRRLMLIRNIITGWKKHVGDEVRFFAGNGTTYSIVRTDDDLTVFLGVAEMIHEMICSIPLRSPDIYLGDKWTIQRNHQRNNEFYALIIFKMTALSEMTYNATDQKRIIDELSIAGDIIRKVCWESYPDGPFKGGFKLFDATLNNWVNVTVQESVKMTLVLLRLKMYFSRMSPRSKGTERGLKHDSRNDPLLLPSMELTLHASLPPATFEEIDSKIVEDRVEADAAIKSSNRKCATRPMPSPVKEALVTPPKEGTSILSLLQSGLWSPDDSPVKRELCARRESLAPTSPNLPKSFSTREATIRACPSSSIVNPIARHFISQSEVKSTTDSRPVHTWTPVSCDTKQIPDSIPMTTDASSDRFFPSMIDGRFASQQPTNSAFWPLHQNVNDVLTRQALLHNPINMRHSFPIPAQNPNQRLVWIPFTLPVDSFDKRMI